MENNQTDELPFLTNVGLLLTYKCTVACPHCIVKAGPHRKEEMLLEQTFNWLDQIKKYRDGHICGISLTGGEPFYNLDHLIQIANYANNLGLIVSVVSNAFWASTRERALEVLGKCSSIQMISISSDIPHQKLIPFSNVKNAVWAAKKLGKLYSVAVCTENEDSPEFKELMDNILEIADAENVNTSLILPVGRAIEEMHHDHFSYSTEPSIAACSMASFPIIFPNGNVIACIGPPITLPESNPLFLGNLNKESLAAIFERAEHNYVLHAIRVLGPRMLVSLLKDNGFENLLPGRYVKNATCDVCYQLLSNKQIGEVLNQLIESDSEFRMKVEYGRQYYLNECEMIRG
jgi:MoaA/NifB/PqqE/SkfB family radical SAM enzyme